MRKETKRLGSALTSSPVFGEGRVSMRGSITWVGLLGIGHSKITKISETA